MTVIQRTFDPEFQVDVLISTKLPIEMIDILPVGITRVRKKLNIAHNKLVIPHIVRTTANVSSGRGRRLQRPPDEFLKNSVGCQQHIKEKLERERHNADFPSLTSSLPVRMYKKNVQSKTPRRNEQNKNKFEHSNHQFDKKDLLQKDTVSEITNSMGNLQLNGHQTQLNALSDAFEPKSSPNNNVNNNTNDTSADQLNTSKHSDISEVASDITESSFLQTLSQKSCCVLIENLPIDAEECTFRELILSFGEIVTFIVQPRLDYRSKVVLLKMADENQCDWVISCLHGSFHEDTTARLVACKITDINGVTELEEE